MPFDIETSHASPTGATFRLYVRHARGTGRGVVQINHGLAEHAARYARFAEIMSAKASTSTRTIIAATASPPRPTRRGTSAVQTAAPR